MGGSVGKVLGSTVGRGAAALGTMGLSEAVQSNPYGIANQLGVRNPLGVFGGSSLSSPRLQMAGGANPSEMLAQTGGAPLLANIAMGADIDTTLAGYLGVRKEEFQDALNGHNTTLNTLDLQNIKNVRDQLIQVQQNRDLKQKAVDNLVQDFPNIVQQNMKMYGDQFDTEMKSYVDQALQGTAAKFAAGGNLSSGAANEAFAKVGADNAMNKLNYANQNAVRDANVRLGEVNALRDFQNTMLGQVNQQGFSANQANLQRQFQGQAQQNDFANQQNLADQQNKNGLFGSIGSLAGTAIGGYYGGLGYAAGLAPKVNTPKLG
jgi:hypothetical protein